jgi:hypothetical protein
MRYWKPNDGARSPMGDFLDTERSDLCFTV